MSERDVSDFEEGGTVPRPLYAGEPAPTAFVLRVVEGPDAGLTHEVDVTAPSPTLVGQSPACAVRLTDPSVSRRHAALEIAGDRLRISDLGSTNGTAIDGVAVVEAYASGGE